jgi:hypothetical protein
LDIINCASFPKKAQASILATWSIGRVVISTVGSTVEAGGT